MSDGKRARLGFIGCGGHATSKLYPCIHVIPEIDLVAVCDLREDLAQRNARNFGARRWYTDMHKMLDSEELDGVFVVGPPAMHYEIGLECLRAGLPIFVEKPSAMDVQHARELAQEADKHGLFGMVAFMKRFAPAYRIAKHLCQQPEFGELHMLEVKFTQGPYPSIWGIESPSLSFLTGQVVHLFDLIRAFGGDVKEVYATHREATPTQFAFAINVTFASGALGILNLNSVDAREPWRDFTEHLCASGLENAVTVDDMLYVKYQKREEWLSVPGLNVGKAYNGWQPTGPAAQRMEFLIGYQGEIQHFAQCILTGKKPTPDLWDGVGSLEITEAVWQSVQTHQIVQIQAG